MSIQSVKDRGEHSAEDRVAFERIDEDVGIEIDATRQR
jgi:hypothetical protein